MQLRDTHPFRKGDREDEAEKLIELKLTGNEQLKSVSKTSVIQPIIVKE